MSTNCWIKLIEMTFVQSFVLFRNLSQKVFTNDAELFRREQLGSEEDGMGFTRAEVWASA